MTTDYEKYIRTDELLALQKPVEALCCDEELDFQTVHQIAELHFKLLLHHLAISRQALEEQDVRKATKELHRMNHHMAVLPEVFKLLEQHLEPIRYHTIRLALGRGSGQDSPGFNRIVAEGPTLWPPMEELLEARGVTLLDVHQQPHAHGELFTLIQALLNFDQGFQNFRYQHLMLVRRMIGLQTNSLKGVPAQQLQRGMRQEFYPALWQVICELTDVTGSSYNVKPLE